MPVRCTKCNKAAGQVTLGKRALKCYKAKHPNCSADDLFCKKCNDFMEEIVAREVAKQKKRKLMERRLNLEGRSTSSSSSTGRLSLNTVVERLVGTPPPVRRSATPNSSGSRRRSSQQQEDEFTSPEIQYTQSQSQPTPRPVPIFASSQDSSQSGAGDNRRFEPVRHEYEEDDSDDEQPICSIAGPSTSAAATRPIVRKRKTAVVFADERIIPIYNQRGNFGG